MSRMHEDRAESVRALKNFEEWHPIAKGILIGAIILFFGLVGLLLSLFVITILKEFVWTSLPNVEPLFETVGNIIGMICIGFVILAIVVIIVMKVTKKGARRRDELKMSKEQRCMRAQMFSIYSEIGLTLTALGPLSVSVISNSTFSPSLRLLLPWISEL